MKRTIVWSAAILVSAALSAGALTLLVISEARIVQESERVVLGTVLTAQAQWLDPDGDGVQSIYTVATFRVDQNIKGPDQPGTLLTLHAFGGTIGNRTMTAPGVPLFQKDERLVLCLTKEIATAKFSAVVGAVQGRWVVRTDSNGVDQAQRDFEHVSFMSFDANGNLVAAKTPDSKEEPLADVLARLQAEAKK
ncbi:MAG: hypothetical protein FD180_695 [Planctomycetota bacterium]|nr:MAG: hypothetical protein FD180_695 [Planctomycetota bacterium]